MSSARPRNVYEARARQKKVTALGEHLWERLTPQERCDYETVEWFRRAPQSFRSRLAQEAEQKPPSEETWADLIVWLEKHVRWARQAWVRAS